VAVGDRLLATRDARGALREYELALTADPTDYDALCKGSRTAVDLGEFQPDASTRTAFFGQGRDLGQRAVTARPGDADGHFALARATGRAAQALSARERIGFGKVVRSEALAALAINPNHTGALHVLGMWHAEVMRLSSIQRFVAKQFLGGAIFAEANWHDGQRLLERAVALDPQRIVHRLDLARILRDRGDATGARAQYDWIALAPAIEYNDVHYQEQAATERRKM
jgi:hypothetical protein